MLAPVTAAETVSGYRPGGVPAGGLTVICVVACEILSVELPKLA